MSGICGSGDLCRGHASVQRSAEAERVLNIFGRANLLETFTKHTNDALEAIRKLGDLLYVLHPDIDEMTCGSDGFEGLQERQEDVEKIWEAVDGLMQVLNGDRKIASLKEDS